MGFFRKKTVPLPPVEKEKMDFQGEIDLIIRENAVELDENLIVF